MLKQLTPEQAIMLAWRASIRTEVHMLRQMLMHVQTQEGATVIENQLRTLEKEKTYINADWSAVVRSKLTHLEIREHVAFFTMV